MAYGRVLAVAAAKAFDADDIMQFSDAAKIAIVVERSLHDDFMTLHFDLPESYPVVLAALLPCFWIYAEVGKDIVSKSVPNNPYQAWIDTYAGEEFHTSGS